jgi:hypothetical protein
MAPGSTTGLEERFGTSRIMQSESKKRNWQAVGEGAINSIETVSSLAEDEATL